MKYSIPLLRVGILKIGIRLKLKKTYLLHLQLGYKDTNTNTHTEPDLPFTFHQVSNFQDNTVKVYLYSVSCSTMSDSLRPHGLQPTMLLCPQNSPGKNTGVDSHSILQGIFPTQGLNPGLLHYRQILYGLSYQGSLCLYKGVDFGRYHRKLSFKCHTMCTHSKNY